MRGLKEQDAQEESAPFLSSTPPPSSSPSNDIPYGFPPRSSSSHSHTRSRSGNSGRGMPRPKWAATAFYKRKKTVIVGVTMAVIIGLVGGFASVDGGQAAVYQTWEAITDKVNGGGGSPQHNGEASTTSKASGGGSGWTSWLPWSQVVSGDEEEEDLDDDEGPNVNVNPKERPLQPWSNQDKGIRTAEPKYMSYLPHSGFHNQRVELQNALALSIALNRILLVPPVWLGHAPGYGDYDSLAEVWSSGYSSIFLRDEMGNANTTGKAKGVASSLEKGDTFVSYDFLFDLDSVEARLKQEMKEINDKERKRGQSVLTGWAGNGLGNRWYGDGKGMIGMSNKGVGWEIVEGGLEEKDIRTLKDRHRYELVYTDHHSPDAPLFNPIQPDMSRGWDPWGQYERSVNIQKLRQSPEKLLLFGTLFGTFRINLTKDMPEPGTDGRMNVPKSWFSSKLVFSEKRLVRAAETVKAIMRTVAEKVSSTMGENSFKMVSSNNGVKHYPYFAAHARTGDGTFKKHADEKMEEVWNRLINRVLDAQAQAEGTWFQGMDKITGEKERRQKVKNTLWKMAKERKDRLEHSPHSKSRNTKRFEPEGSVFHANENRSQELKDYDPASLWAVWDSETSDDNDEHDDDLFVSPEKERRLFDRQRVEEFGSGLRKRVVGGLLDKLSWFGLGGDKGLASASIDTELASKLASRLKCHSPLHTHTGRKNDPDLRVFNVPLYLATDSRHPSKDPTLAAFYATFPCLFTYGDMKALEKEETDVGELATVPNTMNDDESEEDRFRIKRRGPSPSPQTSSSTTSSTSLGIGVVEAWVNRGDDVPLGHFMIPVMDAMFAARGDVVVGTVGSTFGQYIERVLWAAAAAQNN